MNFNVSLKRVVDDSYDIQTGYGLLDSLVSDLEAGLVGSRKMLAVITDDTVDRLYSAQLMKRLADAGFKADKFVIPSGEKSKTRQMKERIEDEMLEKGFEATLTDNEKITYKTYRIDEKTKEKEEVIETCDMTPYEYIKNYKEPKSTMSPRLIVAIIGAGVAGVLAIVSVIKKKKENQAQ